MHSEEDTNDGDSLESVDDDFYSSEDGDADFNFLENESDDSEDIISHRQQVKRYEKSCLSFVAFSSFVFVDIGSGSGGDF